MFHDPFAAELLIAYLDASARYCDAVDDMVRLASSPHSKAAFKASAAKAQELRKFTETTRLAFQKNRGPLSPLLTLPAQQVATVGKVIGGIVAKY